MIILQMKTKGMILIKKLLGTFRSQKMVIRNAEIAKKNLLPCICILFLPFLSGLSTNKLIKITSSQKLLSLQRIKTLGLYFSRLGLIFLSFNKNFIILKNIENQLSIIGVSRVFRGNNIIFY